MKKLPIFLLILTFMLAASVTSFSETVISDLEDVGSDLEHAQRELKTNREIMEERVYLVTDSTVDSEVERAVEPKTVMPEQALSMVSGELVNAELIELNDTVVYKIITLEKRKFLWLISTKVKVVTYIDFYTSEVVKEYPWYNFMFRAS